MIWRKEIVLSPWIIACGLFALASTFLAHSASRQGVPPPAVLYEHARLISGTGSAPLEESAFLVERGTVTRVARKGGLTVPAGARRVDLTGKTVMPVLINTHGHPGFQKGLTYGPENFTRETIVDDLNRALFYGVAVIQSQGIEKGDVTFGVRADQQAGTLGGARLLVAGRGIGAPNAGPGAAAYAGIAYEITTEADARAAVQELAAKKVDLDKEMDDALVASIVQRNIYVMPNLTGEWNTYAERPRWLQDGDPLMTLLQQSVPAPVIDRLRQSYEGRTAEAIERAWSGRA